MEVYKRYTESEGIELKERLMIDKRRRPMWDKPATNTVVYGKQNHKGPQNHYMISNTVFLAGRL